MNRKIENYENRLSHLSTVFYTNMHKRVSDMGRSMKWLSAHSGVSEASLLSRRWLREHRGISLGLAIRVANTLGVTISWLVTDHDDGSRKADTQQLGVLTDSMLEDMQKITKDFSILRGVQKKAIILHAFSYLDYDPFTMDCRSGGESEEKGIAADTAIAHDIDSIEPLGDEDVKKKINGIIKRLNEEIDRKGMTKAEIGEKLGISLSVVSVSLLPDSTRNTDVLRMLDYIDAVNATPEMILDGLETTYSSLTRPQRQARDIMLIANTDMTFAFRNCLAVLDEDEIKAIRVHAESYL